MFKFFGKQKEPAAEPIKLSAEQYEKLKCETCSGHILKHSPGCATDKEKHEMINRVIRLSDTREYRIRLLGANIMSNMSNIYEKNSVQFKAFAELSLKQAAQIVDAQDKIDVKCG